MKPRYLCQRTQLVGNKRTCDAATVGINAKVSLYIQKWCDQIQISQAFYILLIFISKYVVLEQQSIRKRNEPENQFYGNEQDILPPV